MTGEQNALVEIRKLLRRLDNRRELYILLFLKGWRALLSKRILRNARTIGGFVGFLLPPQAKRLSLFLTVRHSLRLPPYIHPTHSAKARPARLSSSSEALTSLPVSKSNAIHHQDPPPFIHPDTAPTRHRRVAQFHQTNPGNPLDVRPNISPPSNVPHTRQPRTRRIAVGGGARPPCRPGAEAE
jgi:hypothetical protein